MQAKTTDRGLPGTAWSRLRYGFLLLRALARRSVTVLSLRSLDYAFEHNRPRRFESKPLKGPLRWIVWLGYWMLGGVATGLWDLPAEPARPSSKLSPRPR